MSDATILSTLAEAKAIDAKARTITHWVTRQSPDRVRDVVVSAGLDWTNYDANPVVLAFHDHAQVIGRCLGHETVEGEGVTATTEFATTPFASELFDLYAGGYMKAWSISFMPQQPPRPVETEQGIYYYHDSAEVLEYSSVAVPCHPQALVKAAGEGSDLAGWILRTYYPGTPETEEARVQADLLRLKHAAESLSNINRHYQKEGRTLPLDAEVLASARDLLTTLTLGEPNPTAGAPSIGEEVATALETLTLALRRREVSPDPQALAAALQRVGS